MLDFYKSGSQVDNSEVLITAKSLLMDTRFGEENSVEPQVPEGKLRPHSHNLDAVVSLGAMSASHPKQTHARVRRVGE